MRVICIDGVHEDRRAPIYLPEGVVLEVYQSEIYICSYKVVGYEKYKKFNLNWAKLRFIPLSEIDEMELVNNKELVSE